MSDKNKDSNFILKLIEHNPEHYIRLNFRGREIHPCARCLGLWIGLITGFILSSPFWLGFVSTENFTLVFIIAWLFVTPAIVDWSTTITGLRRGNNKIRFFTGFLMGLGAMIYLFVLPADIVLKIVTLLIYEVAFYLIKGFYYKRKQ